MEANLQIIDKMCEEHGATATPEAKEALINFAVLFGEKLVRNCTKGRPQNKKLTGEEIKQAYELTKMIRTP